MQRNVDWSEIDEKSSDSTDENREHCNWTLGLWIDDMKDFYTAVIGVTLEYGAQLWNGRITKDQSKEIEWIQNDRALPK